VIDTLEISKNKNQKRREKKNDSKLRSKRVRHPVRCTDYVNLYVEWSSFYSSQIGVYGLYHLSTGLQTGLDDFFLDGLQSSLCPKEEPADVNTLLSRFPLLTPRNNVAPH
jgi:hypothetical protein